jgi:hypothetical protein
MVQIAMLVCGIAAGLVSKSWRQAAVITAAVFTAVLVPQTLMVASRTDEDITVGYWVIQALSLTVGLGIPAALVAVRHRRRNVLA